MLTVLMASLCFLPSKLSSQTSLALKWNHFFEQKNNCSVRKKIQNFNILNYLHFPKIKMHPKKYIVTAYAQGEPGVGNITFTGNKVKHGTVAVDPRVIPFKSKIWIPSLKFYGIADDIGGFIRGHHIDLYVSSRHQAMRFGRKKLDIFIFPSNKPLWRHHRRP